MWGYPVFVLGAVCSFLEPFCGHLSPNIDNVSEKLTLRYPHEGPWVVARGARLHAQRRHPLLKGWDLKMTSHPDDETLGKSRLNELLDCSASGASNTDRLIPSHDIYDGLEAIKGGLDPNGFGVFGLPLPSDEAAPFKMSRT